MLPEEWVWPITPNSQQHDERVPMIREISCEMTRLIAEVEEIHEWDRCEFVGKALSLNISSGGILLLMPNLPEIGRVVRVHVPTPVKNARTPTLAEVRWVRHIPFAGADDLCLVGLKFIF